jgi:hypothetical protein
MSNQRKKEWFDDDAFWRELRLFMFPEKRFADAAAQSGKVLEPIKPKGKDVLDLGCGPGQWRHVSGESSPAKTKSPMAPIASSTPAGRAFLNRLGREAGRQPRQAGHPGLHQAGRPVAPNPVIECNAFRIPLAGGSDGTNP